MNRTTVVARAAETVHPSDDRRPSDDRERVRAANPISDVIGEYVTLLPDGGRFKALCPFHTEKTPSFKVDPERESFHCFGCGERGDVYAFVMKYENIEFPAALEQLAQRVGITLEKSRGPRPRTDELDRDHQLNLRAAEWFGRQLRQPVGQHALEYLERRGFTDETLRVFAVGYAPGGWSQLVDELRRAGISREQGVRLGLERAGGVSVSYDAFRNRVVFPIRDIKGRVAGFGARVLATEAVVHEPPPPAAVTMSAAVTETADERKEPKYINSPESAIFRKGQLLYGHYEGREVIRRSRSLLLMEGYTDVMMAHQAGFRQAVATLGTALTEENATRIARLADSVTLVFDGDVAGRNAALKSILLFLASNVDMKVLLIPGGEDPCDLLQRTDGKARFEELLSCAVGPLEFALAELVAHHGLDTGAARGQVSRGYFKFVQRLAHNNIAREHALGLLSQALAVRASLVDSDFRRWLEGQKRRPVVAPPNAAEPAARTVAVPADSSASAPTIGVGGRTQMRVAPSPEAGIEESLLLVACLSRPQAGAVLLGVHPPERFSEPVLQVIATAVCETLAKSGSAKSENSSRGNAKMGELPGAVAFDDLVVKAKYLELEESALDAPLDSERLNWLLLGLLQREKQQLDRSARRWFTSGERLYAGAEDLAQVRAAEEQLVRLLTELRNDELRLRRLSPQSWSDLLVEVENLARQRAEFARLGASGALG
ncbi:MAG: DNA primase [Planctomycetota bacterium]